MTPLSLITAVARTKPGPWAAASTDTTVGWRSRSAGVTRSRLRDSCARNAAVALVTELAGARPYATGR